MLFGVVGGQQRLYCCYCFRVRNTFFRSFLQGNSFKYLAYPMPFLSFSSNLSPPLPFAFPYPSLPYEPISRWNVCKCCLNDLFIFLQLKTELFYNLSPSPSLSKFILTVIFPNFFPSSQEHLFFSVHIYFSKCIIQ